MRVLILNTLYPPHVIGGAEVSVSLLAEALVKQGDEVAVASLYPGSEQICETRNGVRVYRLPLDNFFWPFGRGERRNAAMRLFWHLRDVWNHKSARRIGAILDAEKPDVMHTNNMTGFSVSVWNEARRRRIRLVHTLRDYTLACMHSGFYRHGRVCDHQCFDCKAFSTVRRAESKKVDSVVSLSNYVLAAHRNAGFFSQVPSSVIYNIVQTPATNPAKEVDVENHNLTFGFIGLIDKRKGIEVVLEATKHLKRPDWKLLIAGRGLDAYVDELKSNYPDPRIQWLGFVDAPGFYTAIDVNLVSSTWPEPLSRSFIESMSFGCSAICARSGGLAEVCRFGKTVALYSPDDWAELAGLMDAAMNDPGRWSAGGFRDDVADAFTENGVAGAYRRVYS